MSNQLPLNTTWFPATVLAVLTLIVAAPLFSCNWFAPHEGSYPLQRIVTLAEEIRRGDLYPRWLSLTYLGKGSPFFNFYSPAAYLFPAYWVAAGLPLLYAVRLSILLVFFGGAWGMYLWSRHHFENFGGLLSAILYLFAPYHFVDIYVRGAFAEFAALAFLPYLFLSIDLNIDRPKNFAGVVLTGISAAAILLTHNLSALMIMPMAIAYALLRLFKLGNRGVRISRLLLGGFIGLGLSSFYWLPCLMEAQYLHDFTSHMTTGYNAFQMHFVEPVQWFSTFWGFGASLGPGIPDGMSFQLGLVLLGGVLLALVTIVMPTSNPRRGLVGILLLCGGMSLLMTSAPSAFIYRHVKIFALVQFPWRYLGPATLFFAAGCGVIAVNPLIRRLHLPVLVGLVVASLYFSNNQRAVSQPNTSDISAETHRLIDSQRVGSLCNIDEYLPATAPLNSRGLRAEGSTPYAPTGEITQLTVNGSNMRFILTGREEENPVIIPWYNFPGWEATLDDQAMAVGTITEGMLLVSAPQGRHEINIRFGTTGPRFFGWLITFLTLIGIAAVWSARSGTLRLYWRRLNPVAPTNRNG